MLSGSPAPNPITSFPSAFNLLAKAVMLMVKLGSMPEISGDNACDSCVDIDLLLNACIRASRY